MKLRLSKIYSAAIAVAIAGTLTLTATAGDLGLIENGDIETESRFTPHGTPGVDHPNGYPDGWHHSANSAWSNGTTDPVTSGIHSLFIPDGEISDHEEMRSFARNLPNVGSSGRTLDVSWNWNWDITSAAGDMFSATIRISKSGTGGSLDLSGSITDYLFLTDGSASSSGYVPFLTSIPLAGDDASFDIIFRTRDNVGDSSETGVLFVDDISARIPEPGTIGLMGLAVLGLTMARRRCS